MNKVKMLFFMLMVLSCALPCLADDAPARASFVIYFDAQASTPRFDATKTLDAIKNKLAENKELVAVIEGHTDTGEVKKGGFNVGGSAKDLSLQRAEYVSNWIASALGSSVTREVKYFRDTLPAVKKGPFSGLFKNTSDNRRVEVKLYTRGTQPSGNSNPMAAGGEGSQVFLPETEFSFKEVYEGQAVVHDFIVRNKGKAPLEILDVKPG